MFNKKSVKTILCIVVFLQMFNLLLGFINAITNPNYQPSARGYLFALLTSIFFGILLLIKSSNKKELVELFFSFEVEPKPEKESIS